MYRTHRFSVHVASVCPYMGTAQCKSAKLQEKMFKELLQHGVTQSGPTDHPQPTCSTKEDKGSIFLFYIRKLDKEFASLVNKRENMHAERISYANKGTRPATIYQVGEKVLIQDHISKRWDRPTVITAIRPNERSYLIRASNGKEYIRSNRIVQEQRASPGNTMPSTIAPPPTFTHLFTTSFIQLHSCIVQWRKLVPVCSIS